MDNMSYEQLRQNGMAPSQQIDMAPLNIPGVVQPASAPVQGVGNIDTRIGELENMFANVHTNRAFTQQEMNDMNQKRQLLDNLYRIRESSQTRALADEERKQKIENLRMVGEESKRKQQEAQTAKRNQVPSTYVLEQMGQSPFVSGGYMVDSSGRKIDVPKYGTVTPAMYQKLGQSIIEGKPAPSASDFTQQTPYSQTQARIERATQQGDYGKAAMLAQENINNLAQIAAMPGLTDEAKQVLNNQMIALANQAKNDASIYQEQVKAKALAQKAALDNQNKMEIERLKSDSKFQKLDQQTQSTIMKIYSDNFQKEVEVPVWDSTKNKWATTLEGKPVTEKRRIIELSPQQVEYLTGRKISAKDYATENYKAQLQMFGIQPTEAPMPVPNVAPQGTQANLMQADKTEIAFNALKAIHQANIPTEKVLKDLSTEEGRKAYRQQFPGIDLNKLIVVLNSSNDSNVQLQTMNKLLQSAKSKGEIISDNNSKAKSDKLITTSTKMANIAGQSPSPQIDLSAIPNTVAQGINQIRGAIPKNISLLGSFASVKNQSPSPQIDLSAIPNTVAQGINQIRGAIPKNISLLGSFASVKNQSLPSNFLRLSMLAEEAGMKGFPQSQLTNYMPTGDRRILVEKPSQNYVYPQDVNPNAGFIPLNADIAPTQPSLQDISEAITEAEMINRKRIANGQPPLDEQVLKLIDFWKQKIQQELYPPRGRSVKPTTEIY